MKNILLTVASKTLYYIGVMFEVIGEALAWLGNLMYKIADWFEE